MKNSITFFLMVSLFFVSCKKNEDVKSTCELNIANLIGTYKINGATYKPDASSPIEDEFAYFELCEKDDLMIVKVDGTYTFNDSGVKCSPSYDDQGIWTLVSDKLKIDGGDEFTISTFNCSKMVLTRFGPDPGEVETLSFAKQY